MLLFDCETWVRPGLSSVYSLVGLEVAIELGRTIENYFYCPHGNFSKVSGQTICLRLLFLSAEQVATGVPFCVGDALVDVDLVPAVGLLLAQYTRRRFPNPLWLANANLSL